MPRRTIASAAGCALLFVLVLVGGPAPAGAAVAQPGTEPIGADATTTSSVVPTLGTAAAPAPADRDDVTVDTLEPSAVNRPLTSSEQRLESLDKWAIGAFVLVSLVVVLVRQRRRRDLLAREDQADDERDEWDAALEDLTARSRGADDAAGER